MGIKGKPKLRKRYTTIKVHTKVEKKDLNANSSPLYSFQQYSETRQIIFSQIWDSVGVGGFIEWKLQNKILDLFRRCDHLFPYLDFIILTLQSSSNRRFTSSSCVMGLGGLSRGIEGSCTIGWAGSTDRSP